MFNGNTSKKGPRSIAMLVYESVTQLVGELFFCFNQIFS